MTRDLVAGIDSSTQSCTVMVRRLADGAVVREARTPHPPTTPPRSEQDPRGWWDALTKAVAPHVGSWHVDVMDGVFAPAFGFGPSMVAALVALNNAPVDVHLMIERPAVWAPRFAAMGARSVSFHVETGVDVAAVIEAIRANGAEAIVALRPETPIEEARPFFNRADGCLLLTAPPGGGAFDERALDKAFQLPEHLLTIVDGRIDEPHFDMLKAAAITDVVIGQALFGSPDLQRRAADLAGLLDAPPARSGPVRRVARPPRRRPCAPMAGDHPV